MRLLFGSLLGVLVLASLVAWKISPDSVRDGKQVLTWVSDDNPARREQLALFNKLHPEYDLRLDASNSGMDKVLVQSSSGVGPDLFDCYGVNQLEIYVQSGIAWDITDELAKRGITKELTWPLAWSAFVSKGRLYGFPANVYSDAIWYHKDLFDKAGVPYPPRTWSWEQFLEVAKKLTVRDSKGRVVQYAFMGDVGKVAMPLMWLNGGRIFNESGTRCVLNSPQNVEALQFWYDLMYKHEVLPSPVAEATMSTSGGWGSGVITMFGDKRCAMAAGGRWWLNTLRSYKDLRLGVCEMPARTDDNMLGGARATIINKHSPHREQALDFIAYLASEPYSKLINDQADAFGPLRRLSTTREFLHNPQFPQETYNDVWAGIMDKAESDKTSPFVNLETANRILYRQLDLIKGKQKTPAQAMRDAQEDIEREMQKNLSKQPALKVEYDRLVAAEKKKS
jgi:multiple sugar transport system substrate-binding protein